MCLNAQWWIQLKNKIKNFNLFEHWKKKEEEDLKTQRLSTFIFLILLVLSIVGLLLYTSLTNVTKTVVVQQPTLIIYDRLQQKYPDTLVCPCQQGLISYETFILSFKSTFNQICTSDFITIDWLNYVNYRSLPNMTYHLWYDFRHSAYSFFNMLNLLCQLVSSTIDDQLIEFYSTNLLTDSLISRTTLNAIVNTSRDQFLSTTANSFLTLLNSFKAIIQSNSIVNRLETNWQLQNVDNRGLVYDITRERQYTSDRSCSCFFSSQCKKTTGIYTIYRHNITNFYQYEIGNDSSFQGQLEFEVEGIYVGCVILDAVLQSNLACLYNTSCLNQLYSYLHDSTYPLTTNNIKALNVSSSSLPTVQELVNNLMVDKWQFTYSFESYFDACNSHSCSYTYAHQFDIIFIITTTIGFVGGIVTILMLTIIPVVTFIRKRIIALRTKRSTITVSTNSDCEGRQREVEQSHLIIRVQNFVLNLNLFENPKEESVWDLRNQRLSTRIFLVSMAIALSFLILFTSLSYITETVIVKQPSVDVYIRLETFLDSETLICPCTSISNQYSDFISFQPTFHQICSSVFLSTNWLDYLNTIGTLYARDFRANGFLFFPTLTLFCNLSLDTIVNELITFNSTKYVTRNVQRRELFQSQTQQIVTLLEQTTKNSFLLRLAMSRQTTTDNALFSEALTNFRYSYSNVTNSTNLVFYPYFYTPDDNDTNITCSCKFTPNNCDESSGIYNFVQGQPILLHTVPGFRVGCSVIEEMFVSSLECLFEQSCLDAIYNLIHSTSFRPLNTTAMYHSTESQYNVTTKLQEIIENLMIEKWNNQTSFQSYFTQCNPEICTYTYNKQADIRYMITIIVGLIGGLTTLLRLIITPLVKFWRRKNRPPSLSEGHNASDNAQVDRLSQLFNLVKKNIFNFNLFKNSNRQSEDDLKLQRISTRIFILLLSLTLFMLITYVSLENTTHTITVKNPNIAQFNSLYHQYRESVQCPCTTLSIEYQKFISLQPMSLHSICSSNFINSNSQWFTIDYPHIKYSSYYITYVSTNVDDFRHIASHFFQVINSLCQLSVQIINTRLLTFKSTTFTTPHLIFKQQFNVQTNQLISNFIENTARSFISILLLNNNMTRGNMLISALSSDSILTVFPDYYVDAYYSYIYDYDRLDQIYNSSKTAIECDCQRTTWCAQQAVVYDLDAKTMLFPIPGVYVGCYIVEAVLQSDLRCFFDVECLKELNDKLNLNVNVSSIVLNSNATRYQLSSSLLEIVSNLMVEKWINQTSYENYLNQCYPESCTVKYISRSNTIYVITTVIGLVGGLTKVYMFVVSLMMPIGLRFLIPITKRIFTKRNRLTPFEQNV